MARTMKERAEAARIHQKKISDERLNKKAKVKLFTSSGVETIFKSSQRYKNKKYDLIGDQWGACGICGNDLNINMKLVHLDHCHETGQIRGVLCHTCNVGLGCFKDNVETIEKAIEYIKYFRRRLPWWHKHNLPDMVTYG